MKIRDLYNAVNTIAPFDSAYAWDNCGLMCGDFNNDVTRVLVTLDADKAALLKAIEIGANAVVSHHPLVFDALKSVTHCDAVYHFVKNGISVISAHTCLDCAVGGVSDTLASLCGLCDMQKMYIDGAPLGTIGNTDISDADTFIEKVKNAFKSDRCDAVITGKVSRVAVIGGSGASEVDTVKALGCDTLVTGEFKHQNAVRARDIGLNLFAFGHFETENIILPVLAKRLGALLPEAEIIINDSTAPAVRR